MQHTANAQLLWIISRNDAPLELCVNLQHAATLQHSAAHCNSALALDELSGNDVLLALSDALQHAAAHCCSALLQHTTAAYYSTLQHFATHSSTKLYTAAYCNTLQQTATHCNKLQHTATNCNSINVLGFLE